MLLLRRWADWKVYIALWLALAALGSIGCASLLTGFTWTTQQSAKPDKNKIYRQCKAAAKKLEPEELDNACDAPNPWKDQEYTDAFIYKESVVSVWRCQQMNFVEKMGQHRRDPGSCDAMQRLLAHGLKHTSISLDFRPVFADEADTSYRYEDKMRDLLTVSKVYHADFGEGTCPRCETLVQLDHRLRTRHRPLGQLVEGQRDKFVQFFRDGFTLFEDLGLNIDALIGEVGTKIADVPENDSHFAVARRLQGLEPIFKDDRILQLASFYLGSAVRVSGYKILRLDKTVSTRDYPSGHWHHDGCGSRLKLFVYLDEVRENGHPTEIARGSQTLAYFSYPHNKNELTRFTGKYVSDQHGHEVVQMLGPRGGGFMFDTNTVHRGNVEGRHVRRDAIIIDIESEEKIQSGSMGKTCPEREVIPVDVKYPFIAGEAQQK